MTTTRITPWWSCLAIFLLSQAGLRAADAVDVTIEADDTTLAVGESTTVTVYGKIDEMIAADSSQIFSWYVDVLNDNGGVVGGFANVRTPASDNIEATSHDGTPVGANLRGIYDTFLSNPGAGKLDRVVLVQFEVTALIPGKSTISVDAGSTVAGGLSDFLVPQIGGGMLAGGNYAGVSVEITVTGEVDLSGLGLRVTVAGGQDVVSYNPVPGFNHTVQFSGTLLTPSWEDLPGGPHNAGVVTQAFTGAPGRFYRVRVAVP